MPRLTDRTLVPEYEDPSEELPETPDQLLAQKLMLLDDDRVQEMLRDGLVQPFVRLSRDVRDAAATLAADQVRWLVAEYYEMQTQRIRADAQMREASKAGEPSAVLKWIRNNFAAMESDIKQTMHAYAASRLEGRWLLSITGIGPVIAAGLLAHIPPTGFPSPAHIWSFAGLNPARPWLGTERARALVNELLPSSPTVGYASVAYVAEASKRNADRLWRLTVLNRARGADRTDWIDADQIDRSIQVKRSDLTAVLAKRPWNADLKVLSWKASTSFVKSSSRPSSYYGPVYIRRKAYEQANNAAGAYAEQARAALVAKNYGEETIAYQHYSQGLLPPAHIQARAMRYASKLLLSHLWSVLWDIYRSDQPKPGPYALAHLGHAEYIAPPNWDGSQVIG
jgi:hypothetical protein